MVCPLHSNQLKLPSGFCQSAGFWATGQEMIVPTGMELIGLAVTLTKVGSNEVASAA